MKIYMELFQTKYEMFTSVYYNILLSIDSEILPRYMDLEINNKLIITYSHIVYIIFEHTSNYCPIGICWLATSSKSNTKCVTWKMM